MAGTFNSYTKEINPSAAKGVNYGPNSQNGPVQAMQYKEPPLKIHGDADRYDHQGISDDYSQAGNLFRLMSSEQQTQLVNTIAGSLSQASSAVIERMLKHFDQCDSEYGKRIRAALKK